MNTTEIEQEAKELKAASAKASREQSILNSSDDYWSFQAFKNAEMKVVKANCTADAEISDKDRKIKALRTERDNAFKANLPVDYQRVKTFREGGKVLATAIVKKAAQQYGEHAIDGFASFRQAYHAIIEAYKAKVTAQPAEATATQ